MRPALRLLSASSLAALPLLSCSASDIAGNAAGGLVGGGRAGEIARAAVGGALDTTQQMQHALSPEQEYYVGRAVAATAVARYGLDPDERRQDYVRKVGATIVALSERLNATYGGYHFAVLDTDLENGLSGPGGYVLITRGALERCRSEDELAGILCHELAHIRLKHGEDVMKAGGPWQQNMAAIVRVIGAAAGADDASVAPNMAKLLGDVVGDFVKTMFENGYGKEFEYQADLEGTHLLYDVGYDASAIRDYLSAMEGREAKTWEAHPPAAERIAALEAAVASYGGGFDGGVGKTARAQRWAAFRAGRPLSAPAPLPEVSPPAEGGPVGGAAAGAAPAPAGGPPAGLAPEPGGPAGPAPR